jgi:hypothetical protein
MSIDGFDWDRGNREKCQKHGVSAAEIEALFAGELTIFPDEGHSRDEERIKAIGRTAKGRCVFLVYTVRKRRGKLLIRPISARYMHRNEVEHYEKEIAKTDKR